MVWPPPIPQKEIIPAALPKHVRQAGLISSWAGIIGVSTFVLTVAIALIGMSVLHGETRLIDYGVGVGYLIGTACEALALIAGIIGRRTKAGKLGLASLGASLAFFVLLAVANYLVTKTWPWDGYNDN